MTTPPAAPGESEDIGDGGQERSDQARRRQLAILRWRRRSPNYLKTPLTKAVVRRFADMEIFVEIQENVRGADVFVDPVHLLSRPTTT